MSARFLCQIFDVRSNWYLQHFKQHSVCNFFGFDKIFDCVFFENNQKIIKKAEKKSDLAKKKSLFSEKMACLT